MSTIAILQQFFKRKAGGWCASSDWSAQANQQRERNSASGGVHALDLTNTKYPGDRPVSRL